jgi:dodecin
MDEQHVYKTIELTGTSSESIEDAVQRAVTTAAESVRHLRWFEVLETRGEIRDGKIQRWQVVVKIAFTLEK